MIAIIGGGFGAKTDYPVLNNGEVILFAHRGYPDTSVENSSAAFKNCLAIGFNAIETDIRCTKDGKLVLFHDESCERLLGIEEKIDELDWEFIKHQPLLYNGHSTKESVLSLDEFLDKTEKELIIYLDVKKANKFIGDQLLKTVKEYKNHQLIIADENILFLAYLKWRNPEIIVALEGFNEGKEWLYYLIPRKFKPDFYASRISKVNKEHMDFFRKKGISKYKIAYGVDHSNIDKAKELGVRNMVLDYDDAMGDLRLLYK